MTRKDLIRLYHNVKHARRGYCCYQEDGLSRSDLLAIGHNRGVYGWNWTAYLHPATETLYISCYRNVPACIVDK